jgi:hypothetical protein
MDALIAFNVALTIVATLGAAAFIAGCALAGYLHMTGNYTEEDPHV